EVYSRITGYYRPVKNWNAGKSQEFKDRRTYRVEGLVSRSVADIREGTKTPVTVEQTVADNAPVKEEVERSENGVILFKTPTCPNCKAAAAMLDKAGVKYTVLNANEERDLVSKYGIKQAPTLVIEHGSEFEKYRGVSDIKGWLSRS
ncbi:MAG: anaerobic ribonucleoside-triphosphate reductase, partial [Erysipelotrichaceae bacterium]|nr:anaerobic ribonucleoside-triphosphate reductase [Erysipelotrichaceae bacterium]